MADSDRDVFEFFRRDPATPKEAAALAYASFAFDKYEWVKKFQERSGAPPTHEQIERWIAELPDSRLEDIRLTAVTVFKATVDVYRARAKAEAYEAGKQDAIVEQVRSATSFWRNLPGNIAVGVVSSFAFALLLVVASLVFTKDPSPIALYQKMIAAPPVVPK